MPTLLDVNQVLKAVYDEPANRLRVITDATVNMSGQMEVAISHTDDSIRLGNGTSLVTALSSGGFVALDVTPMNALVREKYDAISLGYTGSNLTTAVFKQGGLAGSTVATLTLAYTGDRLDSVVRS